MNELDKRLYQLFSDKTLSFGCVVKMDSIFEYRNIVRGEMKGTFQVEYSGDIDVRKGEYEVIGHPPQLHDVMKAVSVREDFNANFEQDLEYIRFYPYHSGGKVDIPYNPTLPLLEQSESTKSAIISLFE